MTKPATTVPVPDRLLHLKRDPHGYPIPWIAFVGSEGQAHFAINDSSKLTDVLNNDLCGICGQKLFVPRWFVGGARAIFEEHGGYLDPPMHHECATYALRVCPYLSASDYIGRAQTIIRPSLFVCAQALRQTKTALGHFVPMKPFYRIEYWRYGELLPQQEGARLVREALANPLPERQPPPLL